MLMQGNSSSNEISYEGRMSGLSSDEIIEQELKKQVRQEDRVGSGAVSRSFDTPSRSSGKRTVLRGSIASQGCLERKAPVYNTAK
jgi:dihydroxyacid dehydratase/phosphogluconate dehydratase